MIYLYSTGIVFPNYLYAVFFLLLMVLYYPVILGITPLHLAAGNNSSLATIQALLLHADIDTSIKNNSNETAYEIAVRSGKLGRFFEAAEHCFNFL